MMEKTNMILSIFADISKKVLAELEDFIKSAHTDGLSETQEYKNFIQNLSILCKEESGLV